MKILNLPLYVVLALLSFSASASVVDTADVTISGNTYQTFQDDTTSLQWLDLDNFYAGTTSYNSIDLLLASSGFHLAGLSEVQALQASIPAIPSNFDAEAQIVGSVNTRELMWGIYEDGNAADGISWTWKYSVDSSWNFDNNAMSADTLFSAYSGDLGAWVVADDISVSAVPVPAAAWLFGSALLGFFGFSRKKANA